MKPLFRSFSMFLSQISKDRMLFAVVIAPILTACLFRFGIPRLELLLCRYFGRTAILSDYYLLFDLLLCVLTPYLFCFASSMVMLTEYDENITSYLAVTPVGKNGYVLSRLIFPAVISFAASVLLLSWFSLTIWPLLTIILTCLLTCLLGISVALLLFSFSRNRVEGMAMAKLSGLLMLGLPVPFFLRSKVQYLFSFLPSFWIAKLCREENVGFFIPALLTSCIWLWLLNRRFIKKLS